MKGLSFVFKGFFQKKRPTLPDSWAVGHLGAERTAFLRINTPLKDRAYQGGLPVSTVFTVPMSELGGEADLPAAFEDALFAELQDAGLGVVAAVVTREATREFITYTADSSIGAKLLGRLRAKFPNLEVSVSSQLDADWQLFHSLLPKA